MKEPTQVALLALALATSAGGAWWCSASTQDDAGRTRTHDPDAAAPTPHRFRRIASTSLVADAVLPELVPAAHIVSRSTAAVERSWSWRTAGVVAFDDARNIEGLLALTPDLVLVSDFVADSEHLARLRQAGIRTHDLGPMRGLDSLLPQIRALGQLLEVPERAEAYSQSLRRRHAAIARHIPTAQRPRALYVGVHGDQLWGGTVGTSYHDILVGAGLRDAAQDQNLTGWPDYTPALLLDIQPDLLVLAEGHDAMLRRLPGMDRLRALHAPGGVVTLPAALLGDPGPGLVDAAEELYQRVHGGP